MRVWLRGFCRETGEGLEATDWFVQTSCRCGRNGAGWGGVRARQSAGIFVLKENERSGKDESKMHKRQIADLILINEQDRRIIQIRKWKASLAYPRKHQASKLPLSNTHIYNVANWSGRTKKHAAGFLYVLFKQFLLKQAIQLQTVSVNICFTSANGLSPGLTRTPDLRPLRFFTTRNKPLSSNLQTPSKTFTKESQTCKIHLHGS